ncbi:hypothetical protein CDAR_56301 [Caerostris darwini]|uniref:Uncharacterized protein n=1 Tax=Caerostris darwini TaxID=1538125 RepID=A0AAV4WMC2_9ARAC|nr:hypothetical protein CDAR_56301 [Caerostris darwini]
MTSESRNHCRYCETLLSGIEEERKEQDSVKERQKENDSKRGSPEKEGGFQKGRKYEHKKKMCDSSSNKDKCSHPFLRPNGATKADTVRTLN